MPSFEGWNPSTPRPLDVLLPAPLSPLTVDLMNTSDWLRRAEAALREAGVPFPGRDAMLLLGQATGRDKAALLAHPEELLPPEVLRSADALLERRRSREPLQYIRGFQEFWGMPVHVGPGCLIPRPETEHLVEQTLVALEGVSGPAVAEVGVGSGCVLMALWVERPDATLVGIDREERALSWARKNLSAVPGVGLMRADLEGPSPLRDLDALVSNPPYITDDEWPEVPPEVSLFEPGAALRCGSDALSPYRSLARWATESLKQGGFLVCELGVAQARRARALHGLLPGLTWMRGVNDLAGHLRVGVWQKD